MNPGELIQIIDVAYKTGDVHAVAFNVEIMIKFIEKTICDLSSDTKMHANGGLCALRAVKKNADNGVIGRHDRECFAEAVKFLAIHILLPNIKETDPQAVIDAGLWDVNK